MWTVEREFGELVYLVYPCFVRRVGDKSVLPGVCQCTHVCEGGGGGGGGG